MCPVPFASSICLLTTGGSALFPQKVWCMRCSEPAQTLPWLTQGSVSGSEQRTLCRRSARCAQYPSLQVFVCSQLVVLRCFHRRCGIFAWRENRDLDVPSTLRFKYLSAHNWWFCAVSTEGVGFLRGVRTVTLRHWFQPLGEEPMEKCSQSYGGIGLDVDGKAHGYGKFQLSPEAAFFSGVAIIFPSNG